MNAVDNRFDPGEEKMAVARAAAIHKAPYFASVIYGFVFTPLEGIGTMLCTPRLILGYDPAWAAAAPVEVLAADIAHEVHHYIRKHFERAVSIDDPALFNIAGDLAINPQLIAEGWKLAAEAIFPKNFGLPDGLTTEEYYQLLRQQKQKGGGGKDEEEKPGQGGAQGQGQGEPNSSQAPPQNPGSGKPSPGQEQGQQPNQGQGQQPGSGKQSDQGPPGSGGGQQGQGKGVCQGHCGGLGGTSEHKSLEKQLDGTADLGRTTAEIKTIEVRLANDIKKHIEQHGRGSVPAGLQDWASAIEEESHIRWQDELAHVLRDTTGRVQAGGDDFSLRRPSRRSLLRGFLRPGMIENLPEVAIIRDTSGSMGQKQLTDACKESYAIMQALGIDEVWFADADTQIATPWKRVGPQFFVELKEAHGRGGTDFRSGIETARRLNPRPDLIVYVTDGDGTTTKMPPPDVAVVWAIVPSYYNKAPAKWGHCVIISDDPKVKKKGTVFGADNEYDTGEDDNGEELDA